MAATSGKENPKTMRVGSSHIVHKRNALPVKNIEHQLNGSTKQAMQSLGTLHANGRTQMKRKRAGPLAKRTHDAIPKQFP